MTAQQLSDAVHEASIAQFGDTGVSMYPQGWWDHDVFVIAPDGRSTPRHPKYCGSVTAAKELAQLLDATSILLGNASNFTGLFGSWNDTKLVPYLVFRRGDQKSKPVNAGLLLDFFNHGHPAAQALRNAQSEVEGAF